MKISSKDLKIIKVARNETMKIETLWIQIFSKKENQLKSEAEINTIDDENNAANNASTLGVGFFNIFLFD